MNSNFERMLQLVDEVFAVKNDPDQLEVDQEVLEHLADIHPATVSEFDDGNGPVAWVLLLPTTMELMQRFIAKEISEKQLYELTPLNSTYETVYLCSAVVLEEFRRQGITRRLTLHALEEMRKTHPIKALFVLAFSKEGEICAEKLAEYCRLPLFKRQ